MEEACDILKRQDQILQKTDMMSEKINMMLNRNKNGKKLQDCVSQEDLDSRNILKE